MEENSLQPTFIINDLDTLKVIADPLRVQVLDILAHEALTVKGLADQLGLAPSKLYYHMNLLEKHDLIRVVETRVINNIIEKVYAATAERLDIDPTLLSFATDDGKENIRSVLTATLDATREEVLRSLEARHFELEQGAPQHPRVVRITRHMSRISDAQAEDFHQRLEALIEAFEQAGEAEETPGEARQTFNLTIAFYPHYSFSGPTTED